MHHKADKEGGETDMRWGRCGEMTGDVGDLVAHLHQGWIGVK